MKRMKITTYCLSAIFAIFLFASCSDDAEIGTEVDLVGQWELSSADVDLKVGPVPLTQVLQTLGFTSEGAEEYMDELESEIINEELSIEFNENNTYLVRVGDNVAEDGEWTLDGSSLTIASGDDEAETLEVLTLDGTTLAVRSTDEFELEVEGTVQEVDATIDYTFTKATEQQ